MKPYIVINRMPLPQECEEAQSQIMLDECRDIWTRVGLGWWIALFGGAVLFACRHYL